MDTKRFNELESKLLKLISETDNQEILDTMLEWMTERNTLNEAFINVMESINKKPSIEQKTATEFAEWIDVSNYKFFGLDENNKYIWTLRTDDSKRFSTKEIYEKFKNAG